MAKRWQNCGKDKIKKRGYNMTFEVFNTGAIREAKKGRGAYNLIPLAILSKIMNMDSVRNSNFLEEIELYLNTRDKKHLYNAVRWFLDENVCLQFGETVQRLAIHFENGAEVHGANNWKRGLPAKSYINSALRHYFKFLDSKDDEDHQSAVLWNLICLIWTIERDDKKRGNK